MRGGARMLLIAVGAAASLIILQRAFDRADHEKAERLVRGYVARPGGPSLEDRLRAGAPPGAAPAWTTELLSSCYGYVRVTCIVGDQRYAFDVDLPRKAIHPGNEAGRAALAALAAAK